MDRITALFARLIARVMLKSDQALKMIIVQRIQEWQLHGSDFMNRRSGTDIIVTKPMFHVSMWRVCTSFVCFSSKKRTASVRHRF